ncbi:MAG TPA: hypothetical protein VM052_06530 [Candidatus Limnocylindrales bacterium]|nr:hypothetical protein [Candidatus Limnocylindrales bacterium]
MLPLGALFAFVSRQLTRLVQLAFGWATLMLFGQVAKNKQIFLSFMALLALVWPIALAGVAFPSVGAFLLGFVTVPDWMDVWVRWGMLAIAVIAPLGVGFLATKLRDEPPKGLGLIKTLLAGYPNALALAVVLLWLMVIAPVMKILAMARRHESGHVPISVKPGGYDAVVDDLRAALERAGIIVRHTFAPWPLTLPGRILALVGGAGVRALVPQHLSQLRAPDFIMTVHPMDLTLSGKKRALAKGRAALVRELTFTQAYQTWSKEAHEIEDALTAAAEGDADVAAIAKRLDGLDLPFEEWEILYRMVLQVRLRRAKVIGGDDPKTSNGHVGLWERTRAAVAALTARA